MNVNDDLTIAARIKNWNIFCPRWEFLLEHPALPLVSLCALSVGLHPYFSDPTWIFMVAIPHLSGEDPDDFFVEQTGYVHPNGASVGASQAEQLRIYLDKIHIAASNLSPLGDLHPAIGTADGGRTLIKITEFVRWAKVKGWTLPDELSAVEVKEPDSPPVPEVHAPIQQTPAPLPKARAQEKRILEIINTLGYDPKNLPMYKPGESGVKSDVRAQAKKEKNLFVSLKVFYLAWERLMKDKAISYMKP